MQICTLRGHLRGLGRKAMPNASGALENNLCNAYKSPSKYVRKCCKQSSVSGSSPVVCKQGNNNVTLRSKQVHFHYALTLCCCCCLKKKGFVSPIQRRIARIRKGIARIRKGIARTYCADRNDRDPLNTKNIDFSTTTKKFKIKKTSLFTQVIVNMLHLCS